MKCDSRIRERMYWLPWSHPIMTALTTRVSLKAHSIFLITDVEGNADISAAKRDVCFSTNTWMMRCRVWNDRPSRDPGFTTKNRVPCLSLSQEITVWSKSITNKTPASLASPPCTMPEMLPCICHRKPELWKRGAHSPAN